MNRRYVIFLIGAVVLLLAVEAWLIYISASNTEESTIVKTTPTSLPTTTEVNTPMNTTITIPSTTLSTTIPATSTTMSPTEFETTSTMPTTITAEPTTKFVTNTTYTTISTTTIRTYPPIDSSTPSTTTEITTSTRQLSTTVTTTPISTTTTDTIMHCSNKSNPAFNYVVRDADKACILTNMSIRINLQYAVEDSQKKKQRLTTNRTTLIVPGSARTTGECGEKMDNMILSWKESVKIQAGNDEEENIIGFHYSHDNSRFFLDFISVDVHLDGQNFPSAKQKRISANTTVKQLFSTSAKDGVFVCKVNTVINIGNQIDVVLSDVRLIAFNQCSKNCSRIENNCITDVSNNAMVGAVVLGIVLLLILLVVSFSWGKEKSDYTVSEDSTR